MQRKKGIKWVRYLFLIVLLVVVTFLLFANRIVEPALRARIHTLITEGSDSLYVYQLGDLKANLLGGNVEVESLHIWVDSSRYIQLDKQNALPSLTMEINLQKGKIRGLSVLGLIIGKRIKISEIVSKDANVKLSRHLKDSNSHEASTPLWKSIQPMIKSIEIDKINLDGIKLLYKNADTSESIKLQFDRCVAQFQKIRIDSAASEDSTRIGFAKEISMHFHDLKSRTADSSYKMKAELIHYSSAKKLLEINGFKLQPTLEGGDFFKSANVQKVRYVVQFKKAVFSNLWLDKFISSNTIAADSLLLVEPDIDISTDKTLPPTMVSKMGKYPQQILLKAKPLIAVGQIKLVNGKLTNAERAAKSGKRGAISFNNINATITNVTNDANSIKKNAECVAIFKANIFNSSPMQLKLVFPLNTMEGAFSAEGSVKDVAAAPLNEVAEPLANVQIKSLSVHELNFQLKGDNYSATSNVQMRYNNLSIVFLKTDEETGVTSSKKFLTKIFNRYTIYTSNPEAGIERQATGAVYARTSSKSFFGVVWKTIFFGIKDIMLKKGRYT